MTDKKRVNIAGVPIDNCTYELVLDRIGEYVDNDRKVYIVTANPEMVLNASRDESFMDVLKAAELTTPDGVGILWAANYLARPKRKWRLMRLLQLYSSLLVVPFHSISHRPVLKQRVTGADLLKKVIERSEEKEWRIFLLGASKGVAEKAISKLSAHHPKAKMVGSYSGSPEPEEEEEIIEKIEAAKPDILFVAYGSPEQEFWIHRNLFKLKTVKVGMGVGGAFDFHSEAVKRAPRWAQKMGMEWVWRLSREPKRLSRIWNATVVFVRLVVEEKNS